MSIAENIRRIRTQHDMTQEEFGKVAAVSAMAVSQWENGRAVPRMGAVQRIADYFNISKGEVIDEGTDGVVLLPAPSRWWPAAQWCVPGHTAPPGADSIHA